MCHLFNKSKQLASFEINSYSFEINSYSAFLRFARGEWRFSYWLANSIVDVCCDWSTGDTAVLAWRSVHDNQLKTSQWKTNFSSFDKLLKPDRLYLREVPSLRDKYQISQKFFSFKLTFLIKHRNDKPEFLLRM